MASGNQPIGPYVPGNPPDPRTSASDFLKKLRNLMESFGAGEGRRKEIDDMLIEDAEMAAKGLKRWPKSPKNFQTPTNPPQDPKIPDDYVCEPGKKGRGRVFRKPGTEGDANTYEVMPPTKEYPGGYWRQFNKYGQPMDPSTGNPGSNKETHIPLPH